MPSKNLKTSSFPLRLNYSEYLVNMCYFMDRYPYGVFLNGNKFKHGFPVELALSETSAFHTFRDLTIVLKDENKKLFGILPYDLKNQLEALTSQNIDELGFDESFFIDPEVSIKLGSDNIAITAEEPGFILKQLENVETTKWKPEELTFTASTSKNDYIENVRAIQDDIINGEVYEINYCTEFNSTLAQINPINTYLRLNNISPTPFSSLVKNKEQWLIGASPERFLKREGNKVLSQPIKGTSKRDEDPLIDLQNRNYLTQSEKEKAENLMIVDLVRNDLAKTAIPSSVKVEELFGVYSFRQVHQMISTVSAQIEENSSSFDILMHAFPMGSMTGAPKIRAMELIEKYETHKRAWFSGAVGYLNTKGDFDFNVVIRSLFYNAEKQHLSFQVGSAITIDSEPEKEFDECLLKAKAILECLNAKVL